jgi:hypothetical protein
MTEQEEAKRIAVSVHLPLVALSFLISLPLTLGIEGIVFLENPGGFLVCIAAYLIVIHVIAAVVGLLFHKASLFSCVTVFAISFLPCGGCLAVEKIQNTIKHSNAPYDRFRENLVTPVPASVSNLRFVPLDEQIRPDLAFRFDIAPEDLDAILTKLNMKQVDPTNMLNPSDYFQYPFYLPMVGPYQVFQGTDKYGQVLTIKTNELHSHAIFRSESSSFYGERKWEDTNATFYQRDKASLQRLKLKYGK